MTTEKKPDFGAWCAYDPEEAIDEYGWLWTDIEGLDGWQLVRTDDDGEDLNIYVVDIDRSYDAYAFADRPYVPIGAPKADGDETPPGVVVTIDEPGGVRTTFTWVADGRSEDLARTIVRALHDLTSNTSSKDH